MALSPFMAAIQQICAEKGISEDRVIETVEAALSAAYRKDYGKPSQNIRVIIDREAEDLSHFKIQQVYMVVATPEEIEDNERELLLDDAQALDKKAEVGQEVVLDLPYQDDFGRIAAQTAKQVIVQRLREAERDVLFEEFKEKEHMLLNGTVQQMEMDNALVSLGKVNGIMPPREQIKGEFYSTGQRIKVFVKEVAESSRGPQIIVSRSDARFIKELFNLEVPEIQAGTVEIKSIAREAGSRTKMGVYSSNPALDPVGSCVGQRGTRVQSVLAEIGEEKIDIILWDSEPDQFIRNALSPAKVRELVIDTERMHANVHVDTDQLSLAIGRGGQNVRLASKLTGYTLDIVREEEQPPAVTETAAQEEVPTTEETKS